MLLREPAVDEFHIDVYATVQRDVRGLRLCQRGGQQARNGDSDKLLVHGVSPLADKMGKVNVLQACHRNLLCDVEKLDSLCQTGRPRGKVKSGRAGTLGDRCC